MDDQKIIGICTAVLVVLLFLILCGCFRPNPPPVIIPKNFPGSDPGACGTTLHTDTYYTMTADRTAPSGTCYSLSGNNITLDCAGYSITAPTAIYTTGQNNVIANCLVKNSSYGIYSSISTNLTVRNNSIYNSTSYGVFLYNSIFNSTVYNNSVSNPVQGGTCYYIGYYAMNNSAYNNTAFNCSYGFSFSEIHTAGFNTYTNNTVNAGVYGFNAACGARDTYSGNNVFNTTYGIGIGYCFNFPTSNSVFINNTLYNVSTGVLITASALASNNTFYKNNITAPVWISDASATNYYNVTGIGNIYYFANGTGAWQVFNITSNNSSHWSNQGTSRPFNATTVGGNFTGAGLPQDWYPWTSTINISAVINLTISSIASKDQFRIIYSTLPASCIAATNQTGTTGIYNITNTGGNPQDAYFYVNQSISCMNLSVSNDSTCANAITLNTTHQKIYNSLGAGSSTTIWAWAAADTCLPIPIPKFNVSAGAS